MPQVFFSRRAELHRVAFSSVLIYRTGAATASNLTPRPYADTEGDQRGLSAFDSPERVPGEAGKTVKVQVIETDLLRSPLRAEVHADGHVSIVPVTESGAIDDDALKAWAAARGEAQLTALTQKILDAIVNQIKVLK